MTWDLTVKEVKDLRLSSFASVLKRLGKQKEDLFRIEIKRSANNKENDFTNVEILLLKKGGLITELNFDLSKTFNKQPFTWKQAILLEILGSPW